MSRLKKYLKRLNVFGSSSRGVLRYFTVCFKSFDIGKILKETNKVTMHGRNTRLFDVVLAWAGKGFAEDYHGFNKKPTSDGRTLYEITYKESDS